MSDILADNAKACGGNYFGFLGWEYRLQSYTLAGGFREEAVEISPAAQTKKVVPGWHKANERLL